MKNKTPLYRVELCERARGKQRFWFRVVHRNGNIIVTSENYARRCDRTRVANNIAFEAGWDVSDVD